MCFTRHSKKQCVDSTYDSRCFDELTKYVKWFDNALFCVDIADFKKTGMII